MADSEPLVVTISHRLGRDEAKRRIDNGLGAIRAEIGAYVSALDTQWDGYRLDFRATALFQTIAGRLTVYDESVVIEVGLPRLLHWIGRSIAGRIEKQGAALLEAPKEKS